MPKEEAYLMKTTFNFIYDGESPTKLEPQRARKDDDNVYNDLCKRYMDFCLFDRIYKSDHNSVWVDRLESIKRNRYEFTIFYNDISNYANIRLNKSYYEDERDIYYGLPKRVTNNLYKFEYISNGSEKRDYYLFDDDEIVKDKLIEIIIPFGKKEKGSLYDPEKKIYYAYYKNKELIEKYKKTYLNVPYNDRHIAKNNNCKWDKDLKEWYTYKTNPIVLKYKHYITRWDESVKKWIKVDKF